MPPSSGSTALNGAKAPPGQFSTTLGLPSKTPELPSAPIQRDEDGRVIPTWHNERVAKVIDGALTGNLPAGRAFEPWEVKKLTPIHVSMCMDRAAGLTFDEISTKYEYTVVYVRALMKNPLALQVIGALQAMEADKATDIHARLQGMAHEMLSVKLHILHSSADNRLRDKIASDLLDRAGYGPRTQVDLNAVHRFAVPAAAAQSLASALSESKRVAVLDYTAFTEGPSAQESGAKFSSVAGPEQPGLLSGASPGASPEPIPSPSDLLKVQAEHDEKEWEKESKARRIA